MFQYCNTLEPFVPKPEGLLESWPSPQIQYLGDYLKKLRCGTVVVESHYIDRDYIDDVALFYSRSLRSYPNYCERLHFFCGSFDLARFHELIDKASQDDIASSRQYLQERYLGYIVVRPLPGYPIGRTVLITVSSNTADALTRDFSCIREYKVNLCGFELKVEGLAFQQQDQGVSACATTAVWSAVNCVSWRENHRIATPAEITQLASKYLLLAGRPLPSEGLGLQQICEAIRGAGLAPLVVRSSRPEEDKPLLLTYIQSGFAPILGIFPSDGTGGHAVCGVGVKRGPIQPNQDPNLHFADSASSVQAIYIHDDRLGPYACADLYPWTMQTGTIRTGIGIKWPGENAPHEHAILEQIIIPLPPKLRLSANRLRKVGMQIADFAGQYLSNDVSEIRLNCKFSRATAYKHAAFTFGLSAAGLRELLMGVVFSRYVGLIEIASADGPLFDILTDVTETDANPSVLAIVLRTQSATKVREAVVGLSRHLAGKAIT